MAVEPEDDELLVEGQQDEGGDADERQERGEEQGSEEQGSEEDQGDEEEVISFGEEPAPGSQEADTPLIKHLRAELRETKKQLAAVKQPSQPQKIEVGPKPTLADCDYDEEAFEQRYVEWTNRKAQADAAESEAEKSTREANEAWQGEVRRFEAKRAELKVPGAQEAIETAISSLNLVQQAVIVKAADNPALVFAALGQHPGKLAEIAQIQDPLKQAAAIAKLEGTLKVTKRRQAPDPEQIATGTARVSQGSDKTLERLEAKAARNGGDRSEIIAYKAKLKSKAA